MRERPIFSKRFPCLPRGAACAALLNEALGSEDKDGDVRPSGKGESLLNKIDLKGMLAARRKDKVASED